MELDKAIEQQGNATETLKSLRGRAEALAPQASPEATPSKASDDEEVPLKEAADRLSTLELQQLMAMALTARSEAMNLRLQEELIRGSEASLKFYDQVEERIAKAGGVDLHQYLLKGYAEQDVPLNDDGTLSYRFRTLPARVVLLAQEVAKVQYQHYSGRPPSATQADDQRALLWVTATLEALLATLRLHGEPGPGAQVNYKAPLAEMRQQIDALAEQCFLNYDQQILESWQSHYQRFVARVRKAINSVEAHESAKKKP